MAKTYLFEVRGASPFPLDMLRRDQCWPDDTTAVEAIDIDPMYAKMPRNVRLRSLIKPNAGRWASFGWEVLYCETR